MHEWEFVAVMILGNVLDWISLAVSPKAMLLLIILGIPVEVCKMRIQKAFTILIDLFKVWLG